MLEIAIGAASVVIGGAIRSRIRSRLARRKAVALNPAKGEGDIRCAFVGHLSAGRRPGRPDAVETLPSGVSVLASEHSCARCGTLFVVREILPERSDVERYLAAEEIRQGMRDLRAIPASGEKQA